MANHTDVTREGCRPSAIGESHKPRARSRNPKAANRRGLETIEAAIMLPFLLLLIAGIIEYGWMFLKFQETTNACRQGARVGARADSSETEVYAAINDAMAAAGLSDATYSVSFGDGVNPEAAQPGEQFSVQVTLQYNPGVTLGMPLVPKPTNLTTEITMMKEGV